MGRGCKFRVNDMQTLRPDIAEGMRRAKELNGEHTPENTSASGKTMIYYTCEHGHTIYRMANKMFHIKRDGNGNIICPVCSGEEIQKGINSLGDLYPELLEEWDYNKNTVSPFDIAPGYNKKVHWVCKNKHTWEASPNARIDKKNNRINGCKYCANQDFWKGWNDLETVLSTYPTEFAERFKREYELAGNTIPLSEVFANSTKPITTKCEKCGTENTRVFYQHARFGCKGCTNQTVTPFNNLRAKNPERADRFDAAYEINKVKAEDIINGGSKKYAWVCPVCNKVYFDTVGHQLNDRGCTHCTKGMQTSRVEQFLYFTIKNSVSENTSNREKVDGKEFDISIPELNIYISYENDYHHKRERTIKKDLEAVEIAKRNNMNYLRIIEDEEYSDITFVEDNIIRYKRKNYTVDRMTELASEVIKWINKTLNSTYSLNIPTDIINLVLENTKKEKIA